MCRRTCDSRARTQPLDLLKSLKGLSRFHSAARRLGSARSCIRAVARCRAEAGLPGASHWRELGPVFWMRGQLPVALALYLWARGAQVPEVVGPYSDSARQAHARLRGPGERRLRWPLPHRVSRSPVARKQIDSRCGRRAASRYGVLVLSRSARPPGIGVSSSTVSRSSPE